MSFVSGCFQGFLFLFDFQRFEYTVYVNLCLSLDLKSEVFLFYFEIFLAIISSKSFRSKNFFLLYSFFSFPSRTPVMDMLDI